MGKSRVIVIGLDGACWEIVGPLIEEGLLPNLARIRQAGFWGKLVSTCPPSSAPAWTSFMTGLNPGKHGIYHFKNFQNGSYRLHLVTSRDIRGKKIWHILNEYCKRVVVIQLPITYPPDALDGAMVTCMLTPSEKAAYTFPPGLKEELFRKFGKHPIEMPISKLWASGRKEEAQRLLAELTELVAGVAEYLLETREPDLLVFVFRAPDLVQHVGLKGEPLEVQRKASDRDRLITPLVRQVYLEIDRWIGKFLQKLEGNDSLIVLSDHGATTGKKVFATCRWLRDEGYLHLKPYAKRLKKGLYFHPITVDRALCRFGQAHLASKLPSSLTRLTLRIPRLAKVPERMVDWRKTRAYALWVNHLLCAVRINLKGREPRGIVEPGKEYEDLRSELRERLLQTTDPETRREIFDRVFFAEELYQGPFISNAPDVIGIPAEKGCGFYDDLFAPRVNLKPDACFNMHQMEGLILGYGPPFKQGFNIGVANILDVAPTILHLFGIPPLKEMDGRVLAEALKPDWKAPEKPQIEGAARPESPRITLSKEDEEEISRRLRDLGYL